MQNNRRWFYLITGTLVLLFLGLIYAWSIFRAPFSEVYPDWTVSQMSLVFTISMCCFCTAGFIGGQLSKICNAKVRLLLSCVCMCVGFFSISLLNPEDSAGSLHKLYILYGVLSGGGAGLGYNTVLTTITKWFPDRVGLASGILLMGFGLGSLILGSIVNALVASSGLFVTFRILAIATVVVMLLGTLIVREPEGSRPASKGKTTSARTLSPGNYSTTEMVRTSRFWIFFLFIVIISAAGLMVINSAASISAAYGGPATLGLVIAIFNGLGRILAGNNFDRFGWKAATFVTIIILLTAGSLMTFGDLSNSLVLVIAGLMCVGLAFGAAPTLTSAYINKAFGPENFTSNYSTANFSLLPAAMLGPMISARLLEAAGGAYGTNFICIIVLAILAFILWILLRRASAGVQDR